MIDQVPVTVANLNSLISSTEAALVPATREAIAVGLNTLLDAMNPPRNADAQDAMAEWWERNRGIYVEALADLPADLLAHASACVIRASPFMPKPADIRRHVERELGERASGLLRLQMARRCALQQAVRQGPAEPVERDLVGIDEMMAEVRRALGGQDRGETPATDPEISPPDAEAARLG